LYTNNTACTNHANTKPVQLRKTNQTSKVPLTFGWLRILWCSATLCPQTMQRAHMQFCGAMCLKFALHFRALQAKLSCNLHSLMPKQMTKRWRWVALLLPISNCALARMWNVHCSKANERFRFDGLTGVTKANDVGIRTGLYCSMGICAW